MIFELLFASSFKGFKIKAYHSDVHADSDINVCTHIEDVSEKAKFVEGLLEVSSRRLSPYVVCIA
jgi:hypothetical protein